MGPNQSANKKLTPDMIKMIVSEPKLLEMVGLKYTDVDGNYTKKYDHGLIPLDTLKELVESPQFCIKDLP